MDPFRYPTIEGAREIAAILGVPPDEMMRCQDWEYTFPSLAHLPEYERIYELPETSELAKRVLGCFIFECAEMLLGAGGSELQVRNSLSRLVADYSIHRHGVEYWAQIHDDYYTAHPEDGWRIMPIVRDIMPKTERVV